MQKKLPKIGHLYHQMFVGPELRNPTISNVTMVNGLGGGGPVVPLGQNINGNGVPTVVLPMGGGLPAANGNGALGMVISGGGTGPVMIPVVTLD